VPDSFKGFFSLAQANKTSTSNRRYGQDNYDFRTQSSRKVIIDDEAELSIEKISVDTKDPIQWFGVLVPPFLKDCQKHFSNFVDTTITEILSLDHQMRQLEIEVGRTRKAIKKQGKSTNDIPQPTT
jgi:hypothetical protein